RRPYAEVPAEAPELAFEAVAFLLGRDAFFLVVFFPAPGFLSADWNCLNWERKDLATFCASFSICFLRASARLSSDRKTFSAFFTSDWRSFLSSLPWVSA